MCLPGSGEVIEFRGHWRNTGMTQGRLTGKIAFITGASSGIGEAIAARFLEEGAAVAGCGRRERSALKHEQYSYTAADVTQFQEAVSAMEAACARFGGVDIVINSAGITGEGG